VNPQNNFILKISLLTVQKPFRKYTHLHASISKVEVIAVHVYWVPTKHLGFSKSLKIGHLSLLQVSKCSTLALAVPCDANYNKHFSLTLDESVPLDVVTWHIYCCSLSGIAIVVV